MQTPVERLESFERIQDRYRKHLDAGPWEGEKEVQVLKSDLVWMCEHLAASLSQSAYEYKQELLNPTEKNP